jgi:hypothetical protein
MSETSSGGIGFFGLLGILFIGLKLGKVIDWSWWLVLLPLYGPLLIILTLIIMAMIILSISKLVTRK